MNAENMFENYAFEALKKDREQKYRVEKDSQDVNRKLLESIPNEKLPQEFSNLINLFGNEHAKVTNNALPTLVLGLEKIAKRGFDENLVTENGLYLTTAEFNPLNEVASWLTRHNPKANNLTESNSYVKACREVSSLFQTSEMKEDTHYTRMRKLAHEANEARKEKEQLEKEHIQQLLAYCNCLYESFLLENQFTVETNVVYNAVRTCTETLMASDPTVFPMLSPIINYETRVTSQSEFNQRSFTTYIMSYITLLNELQLRYFKQLMEECVDDYQKNFARSKRRNIYSSIFVSCDIDQAGALARSNVLKVFQEFFKAASPTIAKNFRDPKIWTEIAKSGNLSVQQITSLVPNPIVENINSSTNNSALNSNKSETSNNSVHSLSVLSPSDAFPIRKRCSEPFDPENITLSQFLNICESFFNDLVALEIIQEFVDFMRRNYNEPEEDRKDRVIRLRRAKLMDSRRNLIDVVFETCDTKGSELIRLNWLELIMSKHKELHLKKGFLIAKQELRNTFKKINENPAEEKGNEENNTNSERKNNQEFMPEKTKNSLNIINQVEVDKASYIDRIEFHQLMWRTVQHAITNKQEADESSEIVEVTLENAASYDENLDNLLSNLLDYIQKASQQSEADRIKAEARKKWLNNIEIATGLSISNMEPIYRAVFQAILKDAEMHGGGKHLSINISVLEKSATKFETEDQTKIFDGTHHLRCIAAFPQEEAKFMIDRILTPDKPNISFQAMTQGRPIIVPSLLGPSNNYPVFLWNEDKRNYLAKMILKAKETGGPLIKPSWADSCCLAIPIEDSTKRIFGVLCVDNCREKVLKSSFSNGEVQFYIGVAKCFSQAYFQVGTWRKFTRLLGAGFTWLCQRASNSIDKIDFYFTQPTAEHLRRLNSSYFTPDTKLDYDAFTLKHLVSLQNKTDVTVFSEPKDLLRKDCLFFSYLFKVCDSSETFEIESCGKLHLAVPIRDSNGFAVGVVDISVSQSSLREYGLVNLGRMAMLRIEQIIGMLQTAYISLATIREREVTNMKINRGEVVQQNEVTSPQTDERNFMDEDPENIFDQMLLEEIRQAVLKISKADLAELKAYANPPKTIFYVIKLVLILLYSHKWTERQFENWSEFKNNLSLDLLREMATFDPFNPKYFIPIDQLSLISEEIDSDRVGQFGSYPAELFYEWFKMTFGILKQNASNLINDSSLDANNSNESNSNSMIKQNS